MDTDNGPARVKANSESSELTREASIAVTIDDLAEGLIVVSFTHSDNLYQGVLFQLNRERGIPSGISFAKEQALGTEKAESDPFQITPLQQRHSYKLGNCNGSSSSSISQPSLRRIIKPPARFKNSRMSLRLRARPVLCAKCNSLCDEKGDSSTKDESSKDDNHIQTDKFNKKDRVKLAGKSEGAVSTLSMNGRSKDAESSVISCPAVDPKDLCYESIGTTRVVENFWKRPLVQPLSRSSEEIYARLRKHKVSGEHGKSESRKRSKLPSTSSIPYSSSTTNGHGSVPQSGSQEQASSSEHLTRLAEGAVPGDAFLTKSTVCDRNFPNTRSRKALNLKMCITKLTEIRNSKTKSRREDLDAKNQYSTSEDEHTKGQDLNSPTSQSDASSECAEPFSSTEKSCETVASSKARGSGKKKAWENRIRTKSTVPVRFRDESYLTKNIFNFNKRRPPSEGGSEIPVLTLCRSDAPNSFKVSTASDTADTTVSTSKHNDDDEDGDDENDDSESIAVSATTAPSSSSSPREDSVSNSFDISSSPHSPTSSSHINESPYNFSIKPNSSKPEMTKTPTIKITFGSCGNGMVVQIPPKDTQHVECSSTTDMKAARKAMKKAKKEARRKRSISPDMSASYHALSPDSGPKCERSNPSSPTVPSDREENPEEVPDTDPSTDGGSLTGGRDGVNDTESHVARLPKKKKKQKKKRRNSKTLKENDCFSSGNGSGHDLSGVFNLPSPYSNLSMNPDSANFGHCSPGNVSVKSCNLDSVSNTEPFESFCKDAPPRRKSVPASSTSNPDTPQRVCINLKRIDTNAYVPLTLHSLPTQSENEEPSSENNDGDESEPNEYPVNESPSHGESDAAVASAAVSVDFYKDKETEVTYKKGDIVWGKLTSCPWWPGKITDILTANSDDARAKISWYKSTTQSSVRFKMLAPFAEYFDSKYARSRRRGLYQLAVRDALVDAHKVKSEDLHTD